jgi:pimeloyl-ACP methyl ester carboxylesterase
MKSTDMMLDVSKATAIGEQVQIAATLHLPDSWDESGKHLVYAIHGGGYSRSYWHPPFADVSYSFARWITDQGKAVVAIDMLGMGQSTKPEPEDVLNQEIITNAHAAALAQVVERIDRDLSITGVGHSMGGMMIISQAAAYPVFDRIAVLGWANEPMLLGDTDVETLRADLIPSGYLATPREPMRKLFYWPDVPLDLIEADEAHASTTPASLGKAALTPGIVHADAASIRVPVLIVQSAIDTSPDPRKELAYFEAAVSTQLQIVEQAAHCQNFAGTRAAHWNALNAWIEET